MCIFLFDKDLLFKLYKRLNPAGDSTTVQPFFKRDRFIFENVNEFKI